MEEALLCDAVYLGNEDGVRNILKENPFVNACQKGHDRIVALLLAHLDVDVNQKNILGMLPFLACLWGMTGSVRLLLKDPRVTSFLLNVRWRRTRDP